MEYHFKIHHEGIIYWAECLEIGDCLAEAHTEPELLDKLHETLNLYLEEPDSPKTIFPMPKKQLAGKNIIKISVNPRLAWAVMLRNARLSRKLTQKEAAKTLNIKNLFVYQKLESPKTANPGLITIAKIKSVFPELKFDLLF